VPTGSITYLGFAGRGEVLLNKESTQGHAKVLVGLAQTDLAQLELLLVALHLLGELVDGIAEGGGEVLAQHHHNAPQHVVVEDPGDGVARSGTPLLGKSPRHTGRMGCVCQGGDTPARGPGWTWGWHGDGLAPCSSLLCDESGGL